MTKDELLTEGEQYADITGYKGDDKEIAACAYMRGAMFVQDRILKKVRKELEGLNDAIKSSVQIGLRVDKIEVDAFMCMLNENKE